MQQNLTYRPQKTKTPFSRESANEKAPSKRIKLTQPIKANQIPEKDRAKRRRKRAQFGAAVNNSQRIIHFGSKNPKLIKFVNHWLHPKSNQTIQYDIVQENHLLRPFLGDYYIGPQNFVLLRNLENKPFLEFQIAACRFEFKIPCLIIPGPGHFQTPLHNFSHFPRLFSPFLLIQKPNHERTHLFFLHSN